MEEFENIVFCFLVLGMGDGAITTLTIADVARSDTKRYLKSLPSRQGLDLEVRRTPLKIG